MRWCARLALAAAVAAAAPARADQTIGAGVAIGGGVHDGAAMTAVDARADWAAGDAGETGAARDGDSAGVALGLGVRVRAVGDALYAADWDRADDWVAILRYLAAHRRRGDVTLELAAGATPALEEGDGALVEGVVGAALLDRRATAARVRVRTARAAFEAVIDDAAAPTVIGARGERAIGEAGAIALEVAGDPAAPTTSATSPPPSMPPVPGAGRGAAPLGAIAASASWTTTAGAVTDRLDGGVTAQLAAGAPGAGAYLGATCAARLGAARFALRGEVTLSSAHALVAPFGPLYAIERAGLGGAGAGAMPGGAPPADPAPTALDLARAGGLAGLGGAARLDVDAAGVRATAMMRARPGRGGELAIRVAAPAFRAAQLAAVVAAVPSRGLWVAGAELRVRAGRRAFVAAEAARQLDPADGRAAWQATAWLGVTTAP